MKNAIKIFVVALVTLAFGGISFAQAKPAIPAVPAAPAMEKKAVNSMDKVAQKAGDQAEEMKAQAKAKGKTKRATKKATQKMAAKKGDMTEKAAK